jgi:NADH-quinone oxidoreductase subunit M
VYGAFCAMAQTDFKRLIAYTSVNHMGYMMMGIGAAMALRPDTPFFVAARNLALQGALWQMITHGVVTGALFFLVGIVYDRMTHTRDLGAYGGLGQVVPQYQFYFTVCAFASLGLPALAGFVSEFMCFVGSYKVYPAMTSIAVIGLIVTAALFLRTVEKLLLGPLNPKWKDIKDMDAREHWSLAPLLLATVVLGVIPSFALKVIGPATDNVVKAVTTVVETNAPGPNG